MLGRLLRNGSAGASRQAVAVCQPRGEGLSAVWVRPTNGGFRVESREWSAPLTGQQGRWLASSRVVLLLPKAAYLIRQLEVPAGCESDAAAVIRLASEALLPPDFGEAEVSYRRLGTKKGTAAYEVYLIRRAKLAKMLSLARRLGVEAEWVLPSAWVHALILQRLGGLDILVDDAPGQTEIALPRDGGGLSVRAVPCGLDGLPDPAAAGYRELLECIRSLSKAAQDGPIHVGWTGRPHPLEGLEDRLEHSCVRERLWPQAQGGQAASLTAAACAIAQAEPRALAEASMLPLELRRKRQQRHLTGRLKAAAVLAGVCLVLSYAALRISMARYESLRSRLAGQLEMIRAEGEAVGQRIDQLRVLQNLRISRDNLATLLQGLREATPEGVTYSEIVLAEDGRLRLRGQAQTFQPLLLPERLEAQPMFEKVLPGDVARVKKSGGSIVEFRLEAMLRRPSS